jgi:hypothetical protein
MPLMAVLSWFPDLASVLMRIRGRRYGGPCWALLTLVLLAGVLAMHGLSAHHYAGRHQAPVPPAATGPVDHRMPAEPRLASSNAGASALTTTGHSAVDRADTGPAGAGLERELVRIGAPDDPEHGVMSICIAVLSLLLLLLLVGRSGAGAPIASSEGLLPAFRRTAGRVLPPQLRPSLTGLGISRV